MTNNNPPPSQDGCNLYHNYPRHHPNHVFQCYDYIGHRSATLSEKGWLPSRKRTSVMMHLFIQFLANQPDYPNALDEWLTDVVARAEISSMDLDNTMDSDAHLDSLAYEGRSQIDHIITRTLIWSDTPHSNQWSALHHKWLQVCSSIRQRVWDNMIEDMRTNK